MAPIISTAFGFVSVTVRILVPFAAIGEDAKLFTTDGAAGPNLMIGFCVRVATVPFTSFVVAVKVTVSIDISLTVNTATPDDVVVTEAGDIVALLLPPDSTT